MKNFHPVNMLLLAVTLIATNAYAVIIEGNFYGTVRAVTNGDVDLGYAGYWDSDIQGREASGSFWYDTEKAPQNSSTFTVSAEYRGYTDEWLKTTYSIAGKNFTISDATPVNGSSLSPSEGLWFHDFDPLLNGSSREMFSLFDSIYTGGFGNYKSIGGVIEINSYERPLLDGLGIVQEFDWLDVGDPTSSGQVFFSVASVIGAEKQFADIWIDIHQFHIGIKETVNVPEPSPLALLYFGVVALLINRKKLNGHSARQVK